MPYEVPFPRLLAEAEAWPLRSELALKLRTTRLRRESLGILDAPTARLAAGLEAHLRPRAGGLSLAGLTALRDRCWFDEESGGEVVLSDYAVRVARTHLACAGARTVLRVDAHATGIGAVDRIAHWRWLSLFLPADLLIAALHASLGTRPLTDHVSLSTEHLAHVLQRPVAETHLHAGAAFGFPMLWTAWMGWLAREDLNPRSFRGGGEGFFGDGLLLRRTLLAVAISRVLLAAFLWHRERRRFHEGFDRFEALELPAICERVRWPAGTADCQRLVARVLACVRGGGDEFPVAHARRLYAGLIAGPLLTPSGTLEDVARADPLASWLRPTAGEACAETLFATRALAYLLSAGRGDEHFAELFWQYQRIRALAHSHLVQEPGTQGLDWFGRHYRRLSPLRGPLEGLRFDAALRHQAVDLRLGALEVRTSPMPAWTEIRDEVRRMARAGRRLPDDPDARRPELGLLFHFLKDREHRLLGRPRLHADPSADPAGFRFGVWFRARRKEALAIETALHHHPELLLLLRGMDVASTELAVPTWATAPLLTALRKTSETVAAVLSRRRPSWRVPPLRVTCHAGEEFSRLVEGLRRVHELYLSGAIQQGDRIGHGLALGTEPGHWASVSGVVVQTAEERLEDVLWELELHGMGVFATSASRLERVRSEAVRLAGRIYGPAHAELDLLLESRRARHRAEFLVRLGFPDRPRPAVPRNAAEALLLRYLTDVGVFRRGQEWVEVRVDDGEVAFLQAVQPWLRALLARLEVTIESNPSSNLLIADMLGVEVHPMLRLIAPGMGWGLAPAPVPEHSTLSSRLMVSINSDDPITFATRLADEYAYSYHAFLRKQLAPATALSIMESLREQGMRSRFTLAASAEPRALEFLQAPAGFSLERDE